MDCIQETKVFTENVVEIDNFSQEKDGKNEIIFNKIENSIENGVLELQDNEKPVVEDKRNATQKAVDELFQPDLSGCSLWVSREDITNNEKLNWGNNGNGRHGIYFGDNRYVWEKQTTKCRISALRTIGFNEDILYGANRPIRDDIHKIIKSKPCVVCGSKSHLVIDHKNDLTSDNIDFISGDETFDTNDPNAMVGTYWYDPVAFMKHIKQTIMSK